MPVSVDLTGKTLDRLVGIESIVGELATFDAMRQATAAIPNVFIIRGESGSGKKTVSQALALSMRTAEWIPPYAPILRTNGNLIASMDESKAENNFQGCIELAENGILIINRVGDFRQMLPRIEAYVQEFSSPIIILTATHDDYRSIERIAPELAQKARDTTFQLPDYSPNQLADIFGAKAELLGIRCADGVKEKASEILAEQKAAAGNNFLRGSAAVTLFNDAMRQSILRAHPMTSVRRIEIADLPNGPSERIGPSPTGFRPPGQ